MKLFNTLLLLVAPLYCMATMFYVDPQLGKINNDGSASAPWSTLSEVVSNNLIESREYSGLPYDPATSTIVAKNTGAPVQAGDTIVLFSGLHGVVLIDSYLNSDVITILAASGHQPMLDHIRFRSSKHWRLQGVTVSSEASGYYTDESLIWINSHGFRGPASHIDIINCMVYSGLDSWNWTLNEWLDRSTNGIYIQGDHVHVTNNFITNIDMAITIVGDSCNIINNQIINFSGDGMRPLGSYLLLEGNLIKNCFDIDDNHDDGIQSFNLGNYNTSNVIIRNNTIINYDDINQPFRGPLQGIGCFDGPYNNWTIENNLISVDHWHGISIYGGYDCIINNNTVIDPTPDIAPGSSWIRINDNKDGTPSERCVVKNNISNKLVVDAEESNNILLTNYSEYDEHFVDYSSYDYHLIASSTAIDAGDPLYTPSTDIEGVARPQGQSVDIGAYEYESLTATTLTEIIEIHFYPNPCSDYLIVDYAGSPDKIMVTNIIGQSLALSIKKEGATKHRINTNALGVGIYFLIVENTTIQFTVVF